MTNSMLAAVREAAESTQEPAAASVPATPAPAAVAPPAATVATQPTAPDTAAAKADGVREGHAAALAVVAICAAANMSARMAESLLKSGLSVEQAKQRVDDATEITARVAMVRQTCPAIAAEQADKYIEAGMSAEEAGRDLLNRMAALQSPEINANHQAAPAKPASSAWDKAVAGVNSRVSGPAAA